MSAKSTLLRHLRAAKQVTYDSKLKETLQEAIERTHEEKDISFNHIHPLPDEIIEVIERKRGEHDEKWGKENLSPTEWLTIIAEEFGEVAKQVKERKDIRIELIDLVAVSIAWLEEISK